MVTSPIAVFTDILSS